MTNKPRITVTLDADLLKKVDDYRFTRRIATQSKAIQRLIKLGFDGMENAENSDSATEPELDHQERELIRIARGLDPYRQELLLRLAATVAEKDAPRIQ